MLCKSAVLGYRAVVGESRVDQFASYLTFTVQAGMTQLSTTITRPNDFLMMGTVTASGYLSIHTPESGAVQPFAHPRPLVGINFGTSVRVERGSLTRLNSIDLFFSFLYHFSYYSNLHAAVTDPTVSGPRIHWKIGFQQCIDSSRHFRIARSQLQNLNTSIILA